MSAPKTFVIKESEIEIKILPNNRKRENVNNQKFLYSLDFPLFMFF